MYTLTDSLGHLYSAWHLRWTHWRIVWDICTALDTVNGHIGGQFGTFLQHLPLPSSPLGDRDGSKHVIISNSFCCCCFYAQSTETVIWERDQDVHLSPSLISLMVSVDGKHHVYLLTSTSSFTQLWIFFFFFFKCCFKLRPCIMVSIGTIRDG